MFTIIILGLAVSAITFTISTTSIFKKLREYISNWGEKWEEWINCPWCLSFWITVLLITVTDTGTTSFIANIVYLFAIMAVSGVFHYILLRAYKPVVEKMVHMQIMKLRGKKKSVTADPTEDFYHPADQPSRH